ncbi:MAG: ATP-binding protein [Ruminococcus sp.]|jgi:energy-coupling factor transporter ATP-binding protein EcfA2
MKKLKRMLLIHWHHYEIELIEFGMVNFLTGKTAAGKTTIIDALQLVLLGDTSGGFFNKAANEKSARTLKSYLFGEQGDDGDAGFHYLRKERFSSYVALEFEDTERKKLFTAGIVCDCYRDQTYDYKWFLLHAGGIPENRFVDQESNTPFDLAGLKTYFARIYGRKKNSAYEFFDTNKRYQEVILGKFGQLKNKYRILLRKAVPFSPISDIEKFITESICDVKNNINVEQMQSDIRQYKNLEEDAQKVRERIEYLKEIREIHENYEREKERFTQQDYIVIRAEQEEYEGEEQALGNQMEEKRGQIARQEKEMTLLKEEADKLQKEREKLEEEYRGSDLALREKHLRERLKKTEGEIGSLEQGIQEAVRQIKSYGEGWSRALTEASKAGYEPEKEKAEIVDRMCRVTEEGLAGFPFKEASRGLSALQNDLNEYRIQLKSRGDQIKHGLEELKGKIQNLEKGIKPFPQQVTALKRLLEAELFGMHKKAVQVSVLADLLEIRDPAWRNAIEGYLDRQKFYLLVPEEYYRDALAVYDQERRSNPVFDAGLVDIGKLRKNFHKKPLAGSLSEEIETENPDGRLYADYLLGGVMKCERAEELNHYKTAVTKTCMLYKGYVSRKLNPSRYATPFIGRRSMELMLEQYKREWEEQGALYEEALRVHRMIKKASETAVLSEYEAQKHSQAAGMGKRLAQLHEEYARVKEEYDHLDLTYLKRMEQEIRRLQEERESREKAWHSLDKKNERLQTELEGIQEEKYPAVLGKIEGVKRRIAERFEPEWIQEKGEPRFQEVRTQPGQYTHSLRERFYASMKQTELKRDRLRKERTRRRSDYNSIYKMPYDIELESNRQFDRELEELEKIRLPEYAEKIRDSRQKAYDQFRDDFIAKIKSNIESVSQQLDELNDSLKKSVFGTDRYRFVKSPRPEYRNYYDMIMDPLLMDTGGWNIASQSFNEKYQKEIDELFQLLILNETNVSAQRRAEYEKSIRKFTDYKTYLVFDLVVTDETGEEQRLSKTLLKKSGGETQIPFYIALLASFSQVCRIRNKNQNNTLRVIILDEAFSKMDGERIRESIRLLRRFELQAIFSAPPDKIPDIAPLVDRNIAVYRDNRHAFTRFFDPREIEEVQDGEKL